MTGGPRILEPVSEGCDPRALALLRGDARPPPAPPPPPAKEKRRVGVTFTRRKPWAQGRSPTPAALTLAPSSFRLTFSRHEEGGLRSRTPGCQGVVSGPSPALPFGNGRMILSFVCAGRTVTSVITSGISLDRSVPSVCSLPFAEYLKYGLCDLHSSLPSAPVS